METLDLKQLKKLAETCRKLGIKHFKNAHFEFTLDSDVPASAYKKAKENKPLEQYNAPFESDTLSEEELMFWSTGNTSETKDVDSGE